MKNKSSSNYPDYKMIITGGGILGLFEAYLAYQESRKHNFKLRITVHEKNQSLNETAGLNIVPSLTPDEILAVVPRGKELIEKLSILFSKKGGIKVEDVDGINESNITEEFKKAVLEYSKDDKTYNENINLLLEVGKISMKFWSELYKNSDENFRKIMEEANFNPCRNTEKLSLHEGFRIDLICGFKEAHLKANEMVNLYKKLDYNEAKILTPAEVIKLDPFLKDFCEKNKKDDSSWKDDAIAVWRPGD